MTIQERNDFAKAISEAIDNDEYLDELLSAENDMYIKQTIRSIINKVRLEYKVSGGTKDIRTKVADRDKRMYMGPGLMGFDKKFNNWVNGLFLFS